MAYDEGMNLIADLRSEILATLPHRQTYLFRSALTTAGSSHLAVRGAGQLLDTIAAFEKLLREHPRYIADTLTEGGITPPSAPDLHFVFLQSGYGVVERQMNSLFRLAN